jgi:hypothetical protein
MNTNSLVQTIRANSGITYDVKSGEIPSTGWAVSIPGCEKIVDYLTEDGLQQYIAEHETVLAQPGNYLGAWFNGDEWYLDVSRVIDDRSTALELGSQWGQIAVFDLERKLPFIVPTWLAYADKPAELPDGAFVN